MTSPASTGSSRRSPSKPRKLPSVQRPPSPELISQDCAFPPFPGMGQTKAKTANKERGTKTRKETGRTRLATSSTNSTRSSGHSPLIHSRTPSAASAMTTASRARSKSNAGEDRSLRPTTAPSGPPPEFAAQSQPDSVPPLPTFTTPPPPLLRADTAPAAPIPTPIPAPVPVIDNSLDRQVTFDSIINQPESIQPRQTQDAESAVFGAQPGHFRRPSSPKQPGYKAKRPPPIVSNLSIPGNMQPSKSPPPPSSSKSLKRTLTEKLFGRRPSNGRRSMVRAALSDDPDTIPPPLPTPFPLLIPDVSSTSARSPDSVSTFDSGPPPRPARPSEPLYDTDLSITRSQSPPLSPPADAERGREASLAALGGTGLGVSGALPQADIEEDRISPRATDTSMRFDFDLVGTQRSEKDLPVVSVRRASSQYYDDSDSAEKVEHRVASQRASIDSASSYGSIGFTERTFSSRSSPPPQDESGRKRSAQEPKYELGEEALAMPAPLRPQRLDSAADSPTDPLFVDGRLSPILSSDKDRNAMTRSIHAQVVQPTEQPHAVRQNSSPEIPQSEDQEKFNPTPAPLFRTRKDSLASGQRPLFERPEPPAEPLPDLPAGVTKVANDDRPSFRQRKDSQASVGGRRAGIKGTCRGCSQPILAIQKSVSSADGRLSGKYHKECFVCRTCSEAFATAEFYVHEDQPYCAHHYHQLSDSLCATCGKGIEGLYMETANVAGRGKEKHHPACLKCATCRLQLTDDYFELSGKVYCERDAFRLASHPRVHSRGPARPSPLVREYIRSGDPGAIKGANFPERRTNRPILNVR
jgi:hypothetical protein